MHFNIMAGGPKEYIPNLPENLGLNDVWIGVDRGVLYLLDRNISVFAAFGDFDSVSEEEWEIIKGYSKEISRYKPEKDETDMELAIDWAIEKGATAITLYGATGGRMDHTVANMQLLLKVLTEYPSIQIEMIDKQNKIRLHRAGTIYSIKQSSEYPYISFFPYSTDIEGLTLVGFKYPLTNRNIPVSSILCISNELISEYGTFSFTKGILMMIRSHD